MKRLRVGVLYGGRSSEHEVSVASAAAVFAGLDRKRYEPVPIRIDKDGRWKLADRPPASVSAADVIAQSRNDTSRSAPAGREVHLVARPGEETILTIERNPAAGRSQDQEFAVVTGLGLDVIFPVLHGPYGEDGTIQGLLELANVPYVGAGVLASAVGMDKAVSKLVFAARGLPIADYEVVRRNDWCTRRDEVTAGIERRLSYPLFVKPASLGSSIGISRVAHSSGLGTAMDLAGEFDRKILVEAAVPDAREIECAVLGNDEPEVSVPGEIIPSREFYDYEAKYLDAASQLIIPADLSVSQIGRVRGLSKEAFRAVDASGMARVDFLLSRKNGRIYVNELNTIPGFTSISMYTKLWEASGLPYTALLDRLVALALERHGEKQRLRTSMT